MSDREVRAAHAEGACTLPAIALRCGAGRDCGGCRSTLASLLAELGDPSAARMRCESPEELLSAAAGA